MDNRRRIRLSGEVEAYLALENRGMNGQQLDLLNSILLQNQAEELAARLGELLTTIRTRQLDRIAGWCDNSGNRRRYS